MSQSYLGRGFLFKKERKKRSISRAWSFEGLSVDILRLKRRRFSGEFMIAVAEVSSCGKCFGSINWCWFSVCPW